MMMIMMMMMMMMMRMTMTMTITMTMTMKSPQLTEQITIRSTARHVSLGFLQPAWKIINIYQSHLSLIKNKTPSQCSPPPPTFIESNPQQPIQQPPSFLETKTPQVLEHRQYLWCHPKAIAPKNFHRLPPEKRHQGVGEATEVFSATMGFPEVQRGLVEANICWLEGPKPWWVWIA